MTDTLILIATAFVAAALSGAAGFGGALLLLPMLTHVVGVDHAVPLLTVSQLAGNLSRVWLGWRNIRWRAAGLFLVTAIPAALAGALLFARLPRSASVRLVGASILLFVALRVLGVLRFQAGRSLLLIGGAAVGLLSGLVGSAGPLGAAIFLSLSLPPVAFVATEATTAVAIHVVKSLVYQASLPLGGRFWPLAMMIAAAMIAGTWVAKRLIERLPRERFEQLVSALLVIVGLQMLVVG